MTWGLALSAGSALGMANAGVIERLEEEGLRPDVIAASSMGAIIGAIYALGLPLSTYRELAPGVKMTNVVRPSERPFSGGLHGGFFRQRLTAPLAHIFNGAVIGDCTIPFLCVAGRVKAPIRWEKIVTRNFSRYVSSCIEEYVFPPSTPILEAILASSAIPVVFSPVTIGGDTFVDICNFGAVPVRALRKHAHPDVVIATNTTPSFRTLARFSPPFLRTWLRFNDENLLHDIRNADLVITPKPAASAFRFDKFDAFIRAGYKAAEKAMPEIRNTLALPM